MQHPKVQIHIVMRDTWNYFRGRDDGSVTMNAVQISDIQRDWNWLLPYTCLQQYRCRNSPCVLSCSGLYVVNTASGYFIVVVINANSLSYRETDFFLFVLFRLNHSPICSYVPHVQCSVYNEEG
jgi:hypothetical protein